MAKKVARYQTVKAAEAPKVDKDKLPKNRLLALREKGMKGERNKPEVKAGEKAAKLSEGATGVGAPPPSLTGGLARAGVAPGALEAQKPGAKPSDAVIAKPTIASRLENLAPRGAGLQRYMSSGELRRRRLA